MRKGFLFVCLLIGGSVLFMNFFFKSQLMLDITPEEVIAEIMQELKLGDGAEKIESYLEKKQWPHAYDIYSDRYQASIDHPESNYHAISIYIYVNKKKEFLRVEARNSYTAL